MQYKNTGQADIRDWRTKQQDERNLQDRITISDRGLALHEYKRISFSSLDAQLRVHCNDEWSSNFLFLLKSNRK